MQAKVLEKRAKTPTRDERGHLVFADFPHFTGTNLTPAEVVRPSYR